MAEADVHRELILPNPQIARAPRAPTRGSIGIAGDHVTWLEIHRGRTGTLEYYLGAPTRNELLLSFNSLIETIPGAELG